ncbi:hypothetical protein LJC71_00185 [Desulfosarcina sp. OttesenSCG-928-A07]|nr:hypothetical protein [Desulfosarcina sp. OttesenSCG-928-G17]MDL2328157.1 hypothetical protein [Desulfosarcina sp. OttesenSCG-928-A07]
MLPPDLDLEVRIAHLTALEALRNSVWGKTKGNGGGVFEKDVIQKQKECTEQELYKTTAMFQHRQRKNTLDTFFHPEASSTSLLLNAFDSLANRFLVLDAGQFLFSATAAPAWVERYSARISTLPLMASILATRLQMEPTTVVTDSIHAVFSGPLLPFPDDYTMRELREDGFADLHLHFANSAHPAYVWLQALQVPCTWLKKFQEQEDLRRLKAIVLPEMEATLQELSIWLTLARNIQEWLVQWLLDASGTCELAKRAKRIDYCCAHPFIAFSWPGMPRPLAFSLHPGEFLPGFRQAGLIVQEGALWTLVFRKLRTQPSRLAARMLRLYHIIASLVFRLSVHQLFYTGFDFFEVLADSPLRDATEKHLFRENLRQLYQSGHLSRLEVRVSGKECPVKFSVSKVRPLIDAYQHYCKDTAKPAVFPPGRRNPFSAPTVRPLSGAGRKDPSMARNQELTQPDFGIICHFIKRRDQERQKLWARFCRQYAGSSRCGGRQPPLDLAHHALMNLPRHFGFRQSLVRQLQAFLTVRKSAHGKYLIAIDGAGSEFAAPPETFAPVFREARHQCRLPVQTPLPFNTVSTLPPLNYTFHAGEDFHHLITGLRAIDEAVEFLDLPPGSRLGHCVALGIQADAWLEMNPELRMPALHHLDDLVWLLRFVDNTLLRHEMRNRIHALSTKIYPSRGPFHHDHDPFTLYQAWEWRFLPVTPFEKLLASQRQLIEKHLECKTLKLKTGRGSWARLDFVIADPKVNAIFEMYQYNMGSFDAGEKPFTVKAERSLLEPLAQAITQAQRTVMEKLQSRHISIETCPSSNVRIAQQMDLADHPIFCWHPKANAEQCGLYPLIATDNPGFCQTSLPIEYCALKQTLLSKHAGDTPCISSRQAQDWLNRINRDTHARSFLVRRYE